jgi:NADH-quinone oxidoreductase subunit M
MEHLLTILIFFPAVAGVLGFLVSKEGIRVYGIAVTFIELILSLWLWLMFDTHNGGMQFTEFAPLIANFGISYNLGVDGISLFLVILTTFMTFIGLISLSEKKRH